MDLEQRFNWKIQKLERQLESGGSPEERLGLAEAYFQMGYYLGRGDDWLEKTLIQLAPILEDTTLPVALRLEALVLRGGALYGKGLPRESEATYREALGLDPTCALALVGLGNLETERRDFRKAQAFFNRAAEVRPDLWQAHYNLGRAAHEEAQGAGYRDADALLERGIFHLVRALDQDPVETVIPSIYKELGELFLHSRRFDDAKKFFTRLTTHERYAPLAYYYLGLTNFALQKHNSAIQNFRRYLKSVPESALAHAKIGLSYLELGEFNRSREACARALELDEGNVLALFTVGCTYLDEDDLEEASRRFERLLEVTPDYVPAFVELTKARGLMGDLPWLGRRLLTEIDAFEATPGLEGGRGSYAGPRGAHRRRIDILLDRLQELGPEGAPAVLDALNASRTESLRFQIWEQLYERSLQLAVDDLRETLSQGGGLRDGALGERLLALAPYLEDETLIRAFEPEEEHVRRQALERIAGRDDIGAYKQAIRDVRERHRVFQGYVLRAMALKGTPAAEAFLVSALDTPHPSLRISAAVALVFYGNARALEILEAEAARLEGPAGTALKGLIRSGWERHGERHKVIHLGDLRPGRREPIAPTRGDEPPPAGRPSHCAICARHQREVPRMLAGRHLMVCTQCVLETWERRSTHLHPVGGDGHCDFCQRSILEVEALYDRPDAKGGPLHICEGCLDLSMGVLRREEVDRFLQEFR